MNRKTHSIITAQLQGEMKKEVPEYLTVLNTGRKCKKYAS